MLDSWIMDGQDQKVKPWTTDEFFGEVRKLSGMKVQPKDSIKMRGLLVSRNESIKAEHAMGALGIEYTIEDVDRQTLRIVSQNLNQAAGALRHAKVTFSEDMPAVVPPVEEPSAEERNKMELPHLLGAALDLSKAMGITPELQMAIQDVITRVQVELGVNG
jgi:hypothetical protein